MGPAGGQGICDTGFWPPPHCSPAARPFPLPRLLPLPHLHRRKEGDCQCGGGRIYARVSRLRAEKGLPQARKEKQPGHSHTGSWKRARLAWVHFSTANMEERPPARVFAFLEDANKSTRQLATGRKSGPKSSRRNKDGMPVGMGLGYEDWGDCPRPPHVTPRGWPRMLSAPGKS